MAVGRRRPQVQRWLDGLPAPARRRDRGLEVLRYRAGTPLRRRVAEGRAGGVGGLLATVPAGRRLGCWLELDGGPVTPLRVQVGSGTGPLAGWVHVDTDPAAPHLEHRSAPWDLPFADGSVAEVLAVDVLETLRPPDLPRTLLEWRRVLEPVGTLEVHGHDATAAMRAYLEGGWERKWAATGALFGLPCDPGDPRPPGAVPRRCALDPELLGDLLGRAGFGDVHTVRASRHGDLGGACADCDAVTAAVPGLRMIVVARPAAGCAGR